MLNLLRKIFKVHSPSKMMIENIEQGKIYAEGFISGMGSVENKVFDYMPEELKKGICEKISEGIKDGSIEIQSPHPFLTKKFHIK